MIAFLAAAVLAPAAVLTRYRSAVAALREPRVFTVDYALEQTGSRELEQTHRVFRAGTDERDEIVSVNGVRASSPQVRIFRNRRYRYTVAALAPLPGPYTFTYAGTHRDGRHVDYVFRLAAAGTPALRFTSVAIDGITFLPANVTFVTTMNRGSGSVTFAKADRWWVAASAQASAHDRSGDEQERITFSGWRFPGSLPPSTFVPRPLATADPAAP